MSECRKCVDLAINILHYLVMGDHIKAMSSAEELLDVLKTYKDGC